MWKELARNWTLNLILGRLAQPFIQKFIDDQKGYSSEAEKKLDIFSKATGLNLPDINLAVMQPRKVAYIEETLRSMENGSLKIRVRSLENEKALERLNLRQNVAENMLVASLLLNVVGMMSPPVSVATKIVRMLGVGAAGFFMVQSLLSNTKIKKFDKTQLKYVNTDFVEANDVTDYESDASN